ncbi:MAG TPA: hypothetical protein VIH71_16020 [Solirubrobacteraceae bacterium]
MPRIIVMADPTSPDLAEETPVLLDEQVRSVHLSTNHAASQLVERLAWAVSDAEKAESDRSERPTPTRRAARSRRSTGRSQARETVSA